MVWKPEHKTVQFFFVKWLQAAMKGTLCVCVAVAVWIVSRSIGSSLVFCDAGMQIAVYSNGCSGVYVVLQNTL